MEGWGRSWAGTWAGGWGGGEGEGGDSLYLDAGFSAASSATAGIGASTFLQAGLDCGAAGIGVFGSEISAGRQPQPSMAGGITTQQIRRKRRALPIVRKLPSPAQARPALFLETGFSASVGASAAFPADLKMTYSRARAEEEDVLMLLLAA